jgi:chromosome segregation ATPase
MIDDITFAQMVAEEVKNKLSPSQRELLMERENWERWRENLQALVDNLDEQIEDIDFDNQSDMERFYSLGRDGKILAQEASKAYEARKKKIMRFRFHVNKRLDDISSMIETGEELQSNGWQEMETLKKAIIKHRALLREFDLEETSIDRALWAVLDNEWLFDSIDESSLFPAE